MTLAAFAATTRAAALALPEAVEDHPWGQSAFKVRGRTFLFMTEGDGWLSLTMKLPLLRDIALANDWVTPAGYGLARSGWVTALLKDDTRADAAAVADWVAASWRTMAPKRLAAVLA